eukprot:CAMPEP_0119306518 /NCGR_PEP_ID=MMETSP1333-20130426/7256_1 /TAXON_ID=418940 /ORGANISM="Scyphosphaera apsteinii, Strain RCC1455" /LENGTH=123 /DNA_ID=CAMNT_0007309835 /DNA_START=79 /DNA_END=450 /DNA_ORIENTATION=+
MSNLHSGASVVTPAFISSPSPVPHAPVPRHRRSALYSVMSCYAMLRCPHHLVALPPLSPSLGRSCRIRHASIQRLTCDFTSLSPRQAPHSFPLPPPGWGAPPPLPQQWPYPASVAARQSPSAS